MDVAIIGGGITGLTAALQLKRSGFTVAVVDEGHVATGESGRTTAHLTELVDARYKTLIARVGIEGARLVGEALRAAIDRIESTVASRDLSCGFRRLPAYLFAEDAGGLAAIDEELRFARQAGIDASFVADVPLPFQTRGALTVPRQAQFHVRQYLLPLAHAIPGNGSHVFESSRATEIEEGEPCRVATRHARIKARDVIVATHAPALADPRLAARLTSSRSYVIATRVKKTGAVDGLFWDTAASYHYIRTQPAARSALLVIGGEDVRDDDPTQASARDLEEPYLRLDEYARARFLSGAISHRWSGRILDTGDGLPYIGPTALKSHVYVATGYSGTGMTFGTLAGMILADLIAGRPTPYAELFAATRVHPAGEGDESLTAREEGRTRDQRPGAF